jgi:AhpD family alkylhydroperoxidase
MLTAADRELVGIGASIGAGCHSCLEYHLDAGARAGLAEADLLKAIEDAECVRRSASGQLSALGRRRLGRPAELPADCCDTSDRAKELSAVGASVAANSQANLEKHLAAAQLAGIGARELDEAVRLARAVQRRAAELLAEEATRLLARPEPVVAETAAASAGCGPDCGCGDASGSSALPVIETMGAEGGCGPDCGCAAGPSEGTAALQVIAAATAVAPAPAATACACGCG